MSNNILRQPFGNKRIAFEHLIRRRLRGGMLTITNAVHTSTTKRHDTNNKPQVTHQIRVWRLHTGYFRECEDQSERAVEPFQRQIHRRSNDPLEHATEQVNIYRKYPWTSSTWAKQNRCRPGEARRDTGKRTLYTQDDRSHNDSNG